MRKQEHDEIKAYLINYINTLWNKNADLVTVFGRDYPKIQLERNLKEFRFNKSSQLKTGGEFDLASKNVYVYNKDYLIYSLANLIRSPIKKELLEILGHELIHAIFSKNLDTEEDINKRITGIEIYDAVEGRVINTPLNEGYTEYIRLCLEKKGHISYKPFVRVFQILEKKLGRQGVIALSKGDVVHNLANAFNMTQDEFMKFCRSSERKYISEKKLEILESKYDEFCEEYTEGTPDSEETRKAIIKFDKSVYKSLYRKSIMDILPLNEGELPTLQEFHEFLTFKIDSGHKQTKKFHQSLIDTAKNACVSKRKNVFFNVRSKVTGFISQPTTHDTADGKAGSHASIEKAQEIPVYFDEDSTPIDGEGGVVKRRNMYDYKTSAKRHDLFVSAIREMAKKNEIQAKNNTNIQKTPYKDYENLDL